jgi:hypothetical protein
MLALALLVLVLIAIFLVHQKKRGSPVVYGSMGCPHTVSHRKTVGQHTFVDCTSQPCPEFVEAYPTTKYSDGSVIVGAVTK